MRLAVAGLSVEINEPRFGLFASRAEPYICPGRGEPDVTLALKDSYLEHRAKDNPGLSPAEWEYMLTGEAFYNELLLHGGFMLHASAVEYEGEAYLFSAPSGTGKSTHTHLWLEYFNGKAKIINDDKPAIIRDGGGFSACGTPWSGKTAESENTRCPLRGIAFIERAKENSAERISVPRALHMLLDQTVRPTDRARMANLLDLLDGLLECVPVYILRCNMTEDAVRTAYGAMSSTGY